MPNPATAARIPVLTPRVIRPGAPVVQMVYQLTAELGSGAGADTLTAAAGTVLSWVQRKFPRPIPDSSAGLQTFVNHEIPGQRVDCVWLKESGEWALRLEQPDAPFGDRPAVAGRVWTADISLARSGPRVRFGIRVLCASLPGCTESLALTRPRTVVELAESVGLVSTVPLRPIPWRVGADMTLDQFRALVISPDRTLPVVVLTEPDARAKREMGYRDFVLDGGLLAARLLGYAHVVLLPFEPAFEWTRLVGKPWSVFGGAVRVYNPKLDFGRDPLSRHPLVLAERILFRPHTADGRFGEGGFAEDLVERVQWFMAGQRVDWSGLPFESELRLKAARAEQERLEQALRAGKTDAEQAAQLARQIESKREETQLLYAELERLKKAADEAIALAEQTEKERAFFEDENRHLRAHIHGLRTQLERKLKRNPDAEVPIPSSFEDAAEWAGQHLAARLVLLPRALEGLKIAEYENPALVYRALLLLAREYRDMRLGTPDNARALYEQARDSLHLRDGGSIDQARAGQFGDTYFVYWPVGSAQRRFLEFHLRCGGNTRDPRRCLAIYFFWDDDTQQVIVGWLPSHLECGVT